MQTSDFLADLEDQLASAAARRPRRRPVVRPLVAVAAAAVVVAIAVAVLSGSHAREIPASHPLRSAAGGGAHCDVRPLLSDLPVLGRTRAPGDALPAAVRVDFAIPGAARSVPVDDPTLAAWVVPTCGSGGLGVCLAVTYGHGNALQDCGGVLRLPSVLPHDVGGMRILEGFALPGAATVELTLGAGPPQRVRIHDRIAVARVAGHAADGVYRVRFQNGPRLAVLNATPVASAAYDVADRLVTAASLDSWFVGGYDGPVPTSFIVPTSPAGAATANRIASILGCHLDRRAKTIAHVRRLAPGAQVVVVVGQDLAP